MPDRKERKNAKEKRGSTKDAFDTLCSPGENGASLASLAMSTPFAVQ